MRKNTKVIIGAFASRKYWINKQELNIAFDQIKKDFSVLDNVEVVLITEEKLTISNLNEENKILVAVPMSGAVQPIVLKAAEKFNFTCIYPGYIKDNISGGCWEKLLIYNAAPAVMDIFSVLKRKSKEIFWTNSFSELKKILNTINGYLKVKASKLLLIGETEPWVISSCRDLRKYKDNLGITIEQISFQTVLDFYNNIKKEEAREIYDDWIKNANKLIEPNSQHVLDASKLTVAILKIIKEKKANGIAIACFDLLKKLNTTACLALSYINDKTDLIASCEGDVDSAVTMLVMKAVSNKKVWMANPNVQADKTINFVHCTAPITINEERKEYTLRNHHESQIGVSPQVKLPTEVPITACRVGNEVSTMTVLKGKSIKGDYELSCRTQLKVKFESFEKYLDNVLGCHQVFVFDDISEELKIIGKMLELNVIY